ncbi:Wall-associated receptor kinase [Musa troglodytarum]|uniref:Wall-associated receptor kinase n=1 Tax=Musa troglodytarum TaxID=320322 RepID=A0A9E7GMQ9_9LILI|nr:Wall-associated receptor kinase [Musa troglodytarum]
MAMVSKRVLLFQIAATLLFASTVAAAAASDAKAAVLKPGCRSKCGKVDIPYPFGIGTDCSMEGFDITCNKTFNPPKPFIGVGNIEILNISLVDHEISVHIFMVTQCSAQSGNSSWTNLVLPYLFSPTSNKFTVVGCSTLAYVVGETVKNRTFASGCLSYCHDADGVSEEPGCDGMGCCQTDIPKSLINFSTNFSESFNTSRVASFNPCSYAFVADQNWFRFNKSALSAEFGKTTDYLVPVVLDWAIRNQSSCRDAKAHPDTYACRGGNTTCVDSTNGPGYLCKCSQGYTGNPYVDGGCQDIDECKLPHEYPCFGDCRNIPGGYNCTCPPGTHGDATKDNCTDDSSSKFPLPAQLAVGFSVIIVILVALLSCVIIRTQKTKHKRERDIFFRKNGGFKLYEEILSKTVDTVQIFTVEELQRATDNFADKRVIGCGGCGMVYRGILDDHRVVAIKKSKKVDERQKDEFVNEIIVLSQINHRHIVRLLGCCLELDVPMLVYEYISNGSLFGVLHPEHYASPLPLQARLTIAEQAAEALAYLHSATNRSIIHGDVKSHNILLDDDLSAKVSDFGASQLVPMDEDEFIMFVQGTLGYLDPECIQTRRLTDRSDVYSFGVVLLEFITGKKAIYADDAWEKRSLATSFLMMMKEQRLRDILDDRMMGEGGEQLLGEVAAIAKECLSVKGEERPCMKEVAERLHSLRRLRLQPREEYDPGEIEMVKAEETRRCTETETSGYHILDCSTLLNNVDAGR